jgi:hypothetical protein
MMIREEKEFMISLIFLETVLLLLMFVFVFGLFLSLPFLYKYDQVHRSGIGGERLLKLLIILKFLAVLQNKNSTVTGFEIIIY